MAELISKEKVIEKIWSVYNGYGNNLSAFSDEKTRAINKACGLVQREVERLPITTEQEIRNKAIEEFAELIKRKSETEWVFDLEDEEQYENFLQEIDEIAESMKGEK